MRVGVFIGSGALAAVGILFIAGEWYGWFPFVLLLLGMLGMALAFVPEPAARPQTKPVAPSEASALEEHLAELDNLQERGIITAKERAAKRKTLLAGWGKP